MNVKARFHWIYEQACDYNLFMTEEDEYDDDDDDHINIEDTLKQQKYTTWFYILLLTSKQDTNCSVFGRPTL